MNLFVAPMQHHEQLVSGQADSGAVMETTRVPCLARGFVFIHSFDTLLNVDSAKIKPRTWRHVVLQTMVTQGQTLVFYKP